MPFVKHHIRGHYSDSFIPRYVQRVKTFSYKFSGVSAPLHALMEKESSFELDARTKVKFESLYWLNAALLSLHALEMTDPNKPFSVNTDASEYQIGAALFQDSDEGARHPFVFWSQTL